MLCTLPAGRWGKQEAKQEAKPQQELSIQHAEVSSLQTGAD
jgi:hypothetical protein